MDVEYFLTERTKFIRTFYDAAVGPFLLRKRLIEDEEPPFVPPYSEDPEPAFLVEWIEADTAIELIGRTCVSMLSDSLKLYFSEWERQLGTKCQMQHASTFKKSGFLSGFRACLQQYTKIDWVDGPFDFDVIEQIVLARNDSQHPTEITDISIGHKSAFNNGNRSLFFAHEREFDLLPEKGSLGWSIMNPKIHVSRENLLEAIRQVELLIQWLEPQLFSVKYPAN
jgi:hypothetical protein